MPFNQSGGNSNIGTYTDVAGNWTQDNSKHVGSIDASLNVTANSQGGTNNAGNATSGNATGGQANGGNAGGGHAEGGHAGDATGGGVSSEDTIGASFGNIGNAGNVSF